MAATEKAAGAGRADVDVPECQRQRRGISWGPPGFAAFILSPPRRFALLSFPPAFLPCFLSFCLSVFLISLSFFHVLFFLSSCLSVLSFFPFLCSFPFCFLFSFFLFFFLKKQDAFCLDSVTGHSPIGIIVVRSVVSDSFCSPRAAARQAPLSMGFSRQEGWTGLPCPPAGGLPRGRQILYSLSLQGSLDVP